MERLVTVADVRERYGCSAQTARKYIRQCDPHMEKPLATFDWAFAAWESGRLISDNGVHIKPLKTFHTGRVIIPRRR